MFRESLSKLEKYEALNIKKRPRSDLSSDRGSGVNLTKMGNQIHKIPNDNLTQRSEARTSNSMLNKRIRTSVADVRVRMLYTIVFYILLLKFHIADLSYVVKYFLAIWTLRFMRAKQECIIYTSIYSFKFSSSFLFPKENIKLLLA